MQTTNNSPFDICWPRDAHLLRQVMDSCRFHVHCRESCTNNARKVAEGDALSEALKSATSYRSIQSRRLETRRIGKLHNRAPKPASLPIIVNGRSEESAYQPAASQWKSGGRISMHGARIHESRAGCLTLVPTGADERQAFAWELNKYINVRHTYTELQVKLGRTAGISIALLHESVCSLHLQFAALPLCVLCYGTLFLSRAALSATSPAATGSARRAAGESRLCELQAAASVWSHLQKLVLLRPWSDER